MRDAVFGITRIDSYPQQMARVIAIPGAWAAHLRLRQGRDSRDQREQLVIRAGNRRAVAEVLFTDEGRVLASDALRDALCLPKGALSVKAQGGELQIGPFVALYALPSRRTGKPFGELTAVFQDMMQLAEQEGVALYAFGPGDANWTEGVVSAYVYRPDRKLWVRSRRPLPDLVLPKILAPPPGYRDQVRRDLANISAKARYGPFSAATGSKWDVHQTLLADREASRLLPQTQVVRGREDIESLLTRYGAVFVKPAIGTQGQAVHRLALERSQRVRVQRAGNGSTVTKTYSLSGAQWPEFVKQTFCGKRRFLVQQALDLLRVHGVRPADFRWLVQKDGRNQWGVTARVARIGGPGAVTTNLHTGGDAVLAESLLQQAGWSQEAREQVVRELDAGALAIARALEAKAGRLGELGIDFAVTNDRRVFLIEINPRPGRQMLKLTAPATRELSLRRNLEYAKYTTGYGAELSN